jgi:hypothetical protein
MYAGNNTKEEHWRSEIDGLEGLSDAEKERAKKALTEISKILGYNISSIVKQRHPITRYMFVNHAPWTWKWLVSLVDSIELVSKQTNGIKIIDMLRNSAKFDEALFHVYIARCILIAGLKIHFLEEDNKNKIADWKITDPDTKEELLVELSELSFQTSEEKELYFPFSRISDRLNKLSRVDRIPQLFYRGKLFKPYISRPVIEELLIKIDSTAEKARKTGFADLIENRTISLAFAKENRRELLKPWMIKNNVLSELEAEREVSDSSFLGAKHQLNEIKRIRSKIEEKKKQLDRKTLNALVIRADRLFSPNHMREYIDTLEQLLFNHNYLALLIVIGGHVGGLEINSKTQKNGHLLLVKSIDLFTKEILILTNKYSINSSITLSFSTKIKIAFESCNTLLF